MMKMLGVIFVALLIGFTGVHGYLKMEYNTMDACDAALKRVKSDLDREGLMGKGQSLLIQLGETLIGSNTLEKDLEKDVGLMGCYKIALMGFEEADLRKPKE